MLEIATGTDINFYDGRWTVHFKFRSMKSFHLFSFCCITRKQNIYLRNLFKKIKIAIFFVRSGVLRIYFHPTFSFVEFVRQRQLVIINDVRARFRHFICLNN